jgi:hypothetical protein
MLKKGDLTVAVSRQVRGHQRSAAGYVVLSRLCQEAWTQLKRWQDCWTGGQEGSEAMSGAAVSSGHVVFSGYPFRRGIRVAL